VGPDRATHSIQELCSDRSSPRLHALSCRVVARQVGEQPHLVNVAHDWELLDPPYIGMRRLLANAE
jgi:hypothetical protein